MSPLGVVAISAVVAVIGFALVFVSFVVRESGDSWGHEAGGISLGLLGLVALFGGAFVALLTSALMLGLHV